MGKRDIPSGVKCRDCLDSDKAAKLTPVFSTSDFSPESLFMLHSKWTSRARKGDWGEGQLDQGGGNAFARSHRRGAPGSPARPRCFQLELYGPESLVRQPARMWSTMEQTRGRG